MKILLDENIPVRFKRMLVGAGYDVEHVLNVCKGKSDKEVFDYACKRKRIIVSLDADFCKYKKLDHNGIIKLDGKVNNSEQILLDILKKIAEKKLNNFYIESNQKGVFIDENKFSKKRHIWKATHRRKLLEVII